jgi:peptide/nickel transport system substrate-binding protein
MSSRRKEFKFNDDSFSRRDAQKKMQRANHQDPRLKDLHAQYRNGHISRREFLRVAAFLGYATLAGVYGHQLVSPRRTMAAIYGDKLRIAGLLPRVLYPSVLRPQATNQALRQVFEYLTDTDSHNHTHPKLLERWEVSQDLQIWTLHLRKNVFFNNGQAFTSDDVVFSMNQWLDEKNHTPMKSILGDYLATTNIEQVDAHRIKLYLNRPEVAVPQHLSHPSALILNHRTFEGDILAAPHGTGPFRIDTFEDNIRCLLKRRYDYWQPGLPYLNQIEFLDLGRNLTSRASALKNRSVDLIDLSDIDSTQAYGVLKSQRTIQLTPVVTAKANVLRMRVDRTPWTDNRVRKALKLCQHREKIRHLAHLGQGTLANDFHVSPAHQEYCQKTLHKFDPRRAKLLLEEAGYPQGLDVHLTIPEGRSDIKTHALVIQGDAARAGFRIHLQEISTHEYHRNRTNFDLAITPWPHFSMGITALQLSMQMDTEGLPGPRNETRWHDEEFSQLLSRAALTLDANERQKIFCKLGEIQMNRGAIGIAYWQNSWIAANKRVQNIQPHPNDHLHLTRVWLKPKRR